MCVGVLHQTQSCWTVSNQGRLCVMRRDRPTGEPGRFTNAGSNALSKVPRGLCGNPWCKITVTRVCCNTFESLNFPNSRHNVANLRKRCGSNSSCCAVSSVRPLSRVSLLLCRGRCSLQVHVSHGLVFAVSKVQEASPLPTLLLKLCVSLRLTVCCGCPAVWYCTCSSPSRRSVVLLS